MRHSLSAKILTIMVPWALGVTGAWAHPGSGIVVDPQGNVYFVHTGRGVGKIDAQGQLTYIHPSRGGHWMCLDREGRFSRTQPKYFERITPPDVKPALIFADGGSPVAVLRDGNLYYASNDERMTPGGLQVTRMGPDGETSVFPPDSKKRTEKLGITGLVAHRCRGTGRGCLRFGIYPRERRARGRVVAARAETRTGWQDHDTGDPLSRKERLPA